MKPEELLIHYAFAFIGREYIYGGAGPYFDCSGFAIDLLKAGGEGPPHDMTAQQLFSYLKPRSEWDKREPGALAFYGVSTNSISHVGFLVSPIQIVEAGGGDSTTTSLEAARLRHAFIRMRLLKDPTGLCGRRDLVAVLKPYYSALKIS